MLKRNVMLVFLALTGLVHGDPTSARPIMHAAQAEQDIPLATAFADPRWQQSSVETQVLVSPSNVIFPKPPEHTKVRALWSKDYLYLRYDCDDHSLVFLPGTEGNYPPRDQSYFRGDSVELFLDPVGDSRMYMEFQFSPNNGIFDAIYFFTTTPVSDSNFALQNELIDRYLYFIKEWNLDGLKVSARIWPKAEGQGWSVIAAFPAGEILKQLGQKEYSAGLKLKMNLVRFNYSQDSQTPEITNWAPVLGGCAHISPQGMGTLVLDPALPALNQSQ